MKKLNFLVGSWSGRARILRTPSEPVQLIQTEEAQYKLDGLLLVIEGVGRSEPDGKVVLQALGIVSYDDAAGTYHMRAYNDGRWLETDVKLAPSGTELTWGFVLGNVQTSSVMRINEKGEWTELTEISVGSEPKRKYMELAVKRQR